MVYFSTTVSSLANEHSILVPLAQHREALHLLDAHKYFILCFIGA